MSVRANEWDHVVIGACTKRAHSDGVECSLHVRGCVRLRVIFVICHGFMGSWCHGLTGSRAHCVLRVLCLVKMKLVHHALLMQV